MLNNKFVSGIYELSKGGYISDDFFSHFKCKDKLRISLIAYMMSSNSSETIKGFIMANEKMAKTLNAEKIYGPFLKHAPNELVYEYVWILINLGYTDIQIQDMFSITPMVISESILHVIEELLNDCNYEEIGKLIECRKIRIFKLAERLAVRSAWSENSRDLYFDEPSSKKSIDYKIYELAKRISKELPLYTKMRASILAKVRESSKGYPSKQFCRRYILRV